MHDGRDASVQMRSLVDTRSQDRDSRVQMRSLGDTRGRQNIPPRTSDPCGLAQSSGPRDSRVMQHGEISEGPSTASANSEGRRALPLDNLTWGAPPRVPGITHRAPIGLIDPRGLSNVASYPPTSNFFGGFSYSTTASRRGRREGR